MCSTVSIIHQAPYYYAAVCPHQSRLAPFQPPTELVLGVKRPVLEAGHVPSSSVEVKNELNFTSKSHMPYGVRSDGCFTFSLLWTLCIFSLKKETVSFCETFAISLDDRQCPQQWSGQQISYQKAPCV